MYADEYAIECLLAGREDLLRSAAAQLAAEPECPDCGPGTEVEDNGQSGNRLAYLCTACGYAFEPEEARH